MISQRKRIKAVIKEYEASVIDPRTAITAIDIIINEKSLAPKKSANEKSAIAFRTLMQDEDNDAVVVLHNNGNDKCMHIHINNNNDPIAGLSDLINKLFDSLQRTKKELA